MDQIDTWQTSPGRATDLWARRVEIFERHGELVVRADVPGLDKDEVSIDVSDEAITIHGERRREQEHERRSDRGYAAFERAIALPRGAGTDRAKARFRDGRIEIRMPAPPDEMARERRVEIELR